MSGVLSSPMGRVRNLLPNYAMKDRDFDEKSVAMVTRVRGGVEMGMAVVKSARWCGDGYGGGEE